MAQPGREGELRAGDPRVVGRYRVLSRLGTGGMGTVYLADGGSGPVALKVVRPELGDDPAFRTRFRREVQACFRVTSGSTARLLDFDTEAEQPWMAVEYVDGLPLDRLVEKKGPLPAEQQVVLALGLADAVVAMHAAGVVHRDLKPANVLCPPGGPRVIDFGIAAAADASRLTSTGLLVGSPGWLAPEQLSAGEVGPATDVFALGLLLGYAASGQPPYGTGPTESVLHRAMTSRPYLDRSRMPPALASMVERATAFDPGQRPTARAVLDEVRQLPIAGRQAPFGPPGRAGSPAPGPATGPPAPVASAGPAFAPPGPWAGAGPAPGATPPVPTMPGPPAAPYLDSGRGGRPPWLIPLTVLLGLILIGGGVGAAVALSHGSSPGPAPTPTSSALPTVSPTASASAPSPGAPAGQYAGTTSQGLPISFVVGSDSQVGSVDFEEQVACTNLPGQPLRVPFIGLPTTKGPLDPSGVFSIAVQLPEQTFRMTGTYSNGTFSGALRHVYNGDSQGSLTLGGAAGPCDSNQITFEASR